MFFLLDRIFYSDARYAKGCLCGLRIEQKKKREDRWEKSHLSSLCIAHISAISGAKARSFWPYSAVIYPSAHRSSARRTAPPAAPRRVL